jgi:hypothetical protein
MNPQFVHEQPKPGVCVQGLAKKGTRTSFAMAHGAIDGNCDMEKRCLAACRQDRISHVAEICASMLSSDTPSVILMADSKLDLSLQSPPRVTNPSLCNEMHAHPHHHNRSRLLLNCPGS